MTQLSSDPAWPRAAEMIELAEREVVKMWSPWGAAFVEAIRAESGGEALVFYRLLCEALQCDPEIRLAFLLELGAMQSGDCIAEA